MPLRRLVAQKLINLVVNSFVRAYRNVVSQGAAKVNEETTVLPKFSHTCMNLNEAKQILNVSNTTTREDFDAVRTLHRTHPRPQPRHTCTHFRRYIRGCLTATVSRTVAPSTFNQKFFGLDRFYYPTLSATLSARVVSSRLGKPAHWVHQQAAYIS
uniref:Uncharacterized protein n=1 Tax=Lygus hesperus TaxID=30085 RepID=A0A146M5J1_LYGHE